MSSKLSERRSLDRRLRGVTMPISRKRIKWGRNWSCLCGSEKKYKNCCINEINGITAHDHNASVETLPEDIQNMIDDHSKAQEKGGLKRNE